jgi:hypothetical protein
MNNVRLLGIIPPAQMLHVDVISFEASYILLDLDLKTTVRQKKRASVVENDIHARQLDSVGETVGNTFCRLPAMPTTAPNAKRLRMLIRVQI